MSENSVTTFGAAPAMLGYLYQVRTALLWAVRESKHSDFIVSLETLDDVTFHKGDEPAQVLQLKHSIHSTSSLTDLSPDLWKSLRIWMVGRSSNEIPEATSKFLISTSQVHVGTACHALSASDTRNIEEAARLLKYAATTSGNKDLADAFTQYLGLSEQEQQSLLSKIYILPGQPDANSLRNTLESELHFVSLHHLNVAVDLLEGWWFRLVIRNLSQKLPGITRGELEARISDIQDSLKPTSLPIDEEIDKLIVALEALPDFSARPFYKQVELVGGSAPRIRNAITSYLQAFRQRSAWMRDDLLIEADLQQYDHRLQSEWELLRTQVCDELGEQPAEEELQRAGRAILKWAEDAPIPIKPSVAAPWICRGSLHMLSDDLKLGWHPNFKARIKDIVASSSSGAIS